MIAVPERTTTRSASRSLNEQPRNPNGRPSRKLRQPRASNSPTNSSSLPFPPALVVVLSVGPLPSSSTPSPPPLLPLLMVTVRQGRCVCGGSVHSDLPSLDLLYLSLISLLPPHLVPLLHETSTIVHRPTPPHLCLFSPNNSPSPSRSLAPSLESSASEMRQ
jgi:hypothetical protein